MRKSMIVHVKRLIVITVLGLLEVTCQGGENSYLVTKDGRQELRYELVLREEQGGFTGTCGKIWQIAPGGHWSVVSFKTINGEVKASEKTRREGKLNSDQLARLAQRLASENLAKLSSHLGPEPSVNPHRYILFFGHQQTILDGVDPRREGCIRDNILNGSPPMQAEEARERDRFANVAQIIEEPTKIRGAEK
jgi:hypothetical protein